MYLFKLKRQILGIILIALAIVPTHSYSQDVDLNDYILDTILRPSATDPSVMDTIITARKKVVVTKEVIVENEIIIPRTLSIQSVQLYGSRDWYTYTQDNFLEAAPNVSLEKQFAYSIGTAYQTNIKEKLRVSAGAAYSYYEEEIDYTGTRKFPYQGTKTITDTLEIYYVGTVPYYLTEERTVITYDTLETKFRDSKTNVFRNITIEFGIGKLLQFDYLSMYPELIIGYRNTFYSEAKYLIPESSNYVKIGVNCNISIPIKTHFGIIISPNSTLISKNFSFVKSSVYATFATKVGLYYTFN